MIDTNENEEPKGWEDLPDGRKRVALQYPVQHGENGETVASVTMRRPKTGDLEAVDGKKDVETAVLLISRLGGIPPSVVRSFDAVDMVPLGNAIADFFAPSRQTGASK